MIYTIKPGAQMAFFDSNFHLVSTSPVSEYHLTAWGMWDAKQYNTPNGKFVLLYKKDLGGNGIVYMGIRRDFLDPIHMSANAFQTSIHGAACDIENNMRMICGQPQYISGPVKYALCVAKCALLHPFNKDKREACKNDCAVLLNSPDASGPTETIPADPPPPPPPHISVVEEVPVPNPVPPGPNAPTPGSMELISLDDLKFIYTKLKKLFTNK
jgi:hypothetical protein